MAFAGVKKIYFIGIKGTALSALALICKDMGYEVLGSDVAEVFITDSTLKEAGISVLTPFLPEHLDWQPDVVIIGTSWDDNNVEVLEAKKRKLHILTDAALRGMLSEMKITLAITGVHGKTTTTALTAYIFDHAGLKPSWLVGTSRVFGLGRNGRWGSGNHFIVEGDEYIQDRQKTLPKFLALKPTHTIITSIEWEHVDVYKDVFAMEKMFEKLIQNTSGKVIACADWPSIRKIIGPYGDKVITYGMEYAADWRISHVAAGDELQTFTVENKGNTFGVFSTPLLGKHNALNAVASIIAALQENIPPAKIPSAVREFRGLERRCQILEREGIIYIDDYGHHPTEVTVTLEALREKYPKKRLLCVFQPHMASRTEKLMDLFKHCFAAVDEAGIIDIFESAREHGYPVTSKDLVQAIGKPNISYWGSIQSAVEYLKKNLKSGDVLITMGAGDVYKIRDKILNRKT